MTDKQIIIDGVDVSGCPAMDTYNIFGIEDKPCCYKFHEYCSAIPNCYFKQLKQAEQKLENIKEKLKQYEKVTKDFDDIEDREIYLVKRESLY